MKGARMKAKRHSRKSCGQEWGQFIIHAYTHTQTGVTIKTVQLFSSESRIKRLSTPRSMRTSDFMRRTRCTQWLSLSTVFALTFIRGSSFRCASCVVVLVVGVLSTSLIVSDVCQLVHHGRAHKSWELPDVHLLWFGG